MAGFYTLQFELGQFREVPCPGVYLAAFQHAEAIQAEFLHGKAAQHGAVDHCAAKRGVAQILGACQIAHEATREAVAGPGGIMRLLQRKRRHAKYAVLVDHHGPVFAALHHER